MGAQAVRLSNVDIDNALNNQEFEVLFQPIFDLGNGALARMETFVRWRHPALGLLPPGAFISFFESQGRMSELSRYVLDEALSNYLKWRGNYGPGFSINLALSDLNDEALASHLTVLLREHDFPADAVTLECPMPPVTMDPVQAREQFEALRKTGARLAIEVRQRANDFLRTVDPFPFDEIKTGGAAILRFARTVRGPGLSAISELLDIASDANASITAVGVEDQASLSALRGLGFSAAQGNHLAKVGGLNDFRPAMVNTVRKLLDLDDLSTRELGELFRTQHIADSIEGDASDTKAKTKTKTTKTAPPPPIKGETTAARARRKAAALAKKKGKETLRAEITARREKLGLSAPPADSLDQVPAARGLQDRLNSEFTPPDDAPSDMESPDAQEREVAAIDAIGTLNAPEEITEEIADHAPAGESDHHADDHGTLDHETLDHETLDQEALEIDEPPEEPPGEPMEADTPLVPEATPAISEPATAAPAAAEPAQPTDQPPPEPQPADKPSPIDSPAQASLHIENAGAYMINSWPVTFTPDEVITIEPVPLTAQEQQERREMEANLVLFSLDTEEPAPAPPTPAAMAPLANIAPEAKTEPGDTREALAEAPDEMVSEAASAPAGAPASEDDLLDLDQPINKDSLTQAPTIAETSLIRESLTIADTHPGKPRNRNFLTRKYHLLPDHFWPRSWTRAWQHREANRDFVRRAKLAAERLNAPDSKPRDALF